MTAEAEKQERIGVLLFNLGGPETLDEVKPFLYNLFSDPDIIRIRWGPLRKAIAWFIATTRNKKSSGYYKKIGGGSPLREITDQQASALQASLAAEGVDAGVYVGMRCWNPLIEDALADIRREGIARLVVLPLYPQYSIATTGSSLKRLNELLDQDGKRGLSISVINSYHDDQKYIDALAATVPQELAKFDEPARTHIIFSAHSVPVSYIESGDPYLDQTKRTVELVMEKLGSDRPHSLSFQSKVGPVKWLEPSTDQTIRRLAAEGVTQLLLVPVSFVSEHIETLYELDILYRDVAKEVGLPAYRRVPALNTQQEFIDALARLVMGALREGSEA
ncbi:MAG TPA: ferrochelatase [Blastocatellia bacterium]|nr:ferrochelatase [Blastocatellia bacterium]